MADRKAAWDYIRSSIKPDIGLVQEAIPPAEIEKVVWRKEGILDHRKLPSKNLGWGSAVVSFGPEIESVEYANSPFHTHPIPLKRTFPGSIAIAKVKGIDLILISAYGVFEYGCADITMHRVLSDITPLIDETKGTRIIIAGDLNVTTQWSEKHASTLRGRHKEYLRQEKNLFARFESLGFSNIAVGSQPLIGCECDEGSNCRHVQTQRHSRSPFPFQNDYVFVTADLLNQLQKVEVINDESVWKLSDHCPIAFELDL